jgi:hypothetical protein
MPGGQRTAPARRIVVSFADGKVIQVPIIPDRRGLNHFARTLPNAALISLGFHPCGAPGFGQSACRIVAAQGVEGRANNLGILCSIHLSYEGAMRFRGVSGFPVGCPLVAVT